MIGKLESIHSEKTQILEELFRDYEGPNFSVRLWDGVSWHFSDREKAVCTIVFENASSLRTLMVNPSEITLGEAFIHGDVDVEGDLFSVFDIVEYILRRPAEFQRNLVYSLSKTSLRFQQWLREAGRHSRRRDQASISYHYDQPVEFYRLWLGKTLAYSCAYFQSGGESLDAAQENKLELICRKLRLNPLDRMLDIGCGWGSLILHAASEHGAYAHGVTLSQRQAATAAERIKAMNVTQSCVVQLEDYRAIGSLLPFDKIASVGMFEHVGLKNLPQYFSIAHQLLKPGGVFLNHGIARSPFSHPREASFIDRYVFPDGELVTISEALKIAENAGFEVRDVENLREHYERTLRLWVHGLQENSAAALQYVSKSTYRIWLLYMAGSAAAFRRGDIAIYQTLLSKPLRGRAFLPLTRADWYRPAGAKPQPVSGARPGEGQSAAAGSDEAQ